MSNNKELIIKNVKKAIVLIIIGALIVTLFNLEYILAKLTLNKILDKTDIESDIYIPEGILRITSEYKGDIESYKVVLKSLDNIANNVIPKYYEKINGKTDEELKSDFENRKKVILIETGIETSEEYINFAKHLSTLSNENLIVQDYYVDITTIVIKYNRIESNIIFEYENGQEIALKITLKNITQEDVSPIKYTAP